MQAGRTFPTVHGRIASALFSTTQRKVLGLLFGRPDKSFLTTEIIALCGGGSGGVQRELAKLRGSGLILVNRVGRQAHYRANPQSPVFAELSSLIRKTVGLMDPLRDALVPLESRIGIAFVYGSVSCGEDGVGSDVDVLVVSDSLELEELFRALGKAEEELGRSVHPLLMRRHEFEKRHSEPGSFIQKVLAGPVMWLMGDSDVLHHAW